MPLKRLGNLKEDEGNKCIPRSGFEGGNRLVCAGIQDSTIGCKSSRGTLLHLSYISQNMFLFDLCLERNFYPLYSHSHNKKDIKLLSEGWIAKFLFLCLSCLWNIGFACRVAVLYGSTAVQRCVPALAPTSRLRRTWSADCGERGPHAVSRELKSGGSVLVSLWRWRHSEVIQLFSASIYLAFDSILSKTAVVVVLV